jgi:predicted XRE-type DNA-binding protein
MLFLTKKYFYDILYARGDTMTKDELNTFIRVKMIESGKMTQAKAAAFLGMPQSNFSRKLRSGTFTYIEMEKLAETLGYTIEWIKK